MRRMLVAALAALGTGTILLSGPGPRGEAQSAGSPFLGASPKAIQFKPIDTTTAIGHLNTQKMMTHTPKLAGAPNLGNFFPKIPQLSLPNKVAATPMIDPHKNPLQSVPAKSQYLKLRASVTSTTYVSLAGHRALEFALTFRLAQPTGGTFVWNTVQDFVAANDLMYIVSFGGSSIEFGNIRTTLDVS